MEGVEALALVVGEPRDTLLVKVGEQRVANGSCGVGTDRHQDVAEVHQRRDFVLVALTEGLEVAVGLALP